MAGRWRCCHHRRSPAGRGGISGAKGGGPTGLIAYTLLACLGVRPYPHPHRLLARCEVSIGQDRLFLWGEIIPDISLKEDLLYPLPDLFFRHGASMRSRSRTSKPYLSLAGVPMGGRAAQAALGMVSFRDSSFSFAPPARAESLGWAMLSSNQRP